MKRLALPAPVRRRLPPRPRRTSRRGRHALEHAIVDLGRDDPPGLRSGRSRTASISFADGVIGEVGKVAVRRRARP